MVFGFGSNDPAKIAWQNLEQATARGISSIDKREAAAKIFHEEKGHVHGALMLALYYRATIPSRDYEAEEAYKAWQEMLGRCEKYGRAKVDPFGLEVKGKENWYIFQRNQAAECRESSNAADQEYVKAFVEDWNNKHGAPQ